MKTPTLAALMTASVLFAQPVLADNKVSIAVTNLTRGFHFTPLLIEAHDDDVHLFRPGQPASPALQAMAEGGDISGLVNLAGNAGAAVVQNPAAGLLAPGASTAAEIRINEHRQGYLSIVAMLLPTNDGFVGLDAWPIPSKKGTYTVDLVALDAGTEANDEVINGGGAPGTPGIPAAPGGDGGIGGTGVMATIEGYVHVHRGTLGDTNPSGGMSDLDSRIHRWHNPVARVTVTVR